MKRVADCLLPSLFSLLAPTLHAAELLVDRNDSTCSDVIGLPYCTISAALANAVGGDSILVYASTYIENIDFDGKDVFLKSAQGPAVTTIEGTVGTVVSIGPQGRIEGFTIKDGVASFGAGMSISGSDTIVKNNVFEQNMQSSGGFGAAIAGNNASPIIEANVFEGNSCDSQSASGVVSFVNFSNPLIFNNVFLDNACRAISIAVPLGAAPFISNNTIVGNPVGIHIDRVVSTALHEYRNNLIADNTIGVEVDFGNETLNPVWENNLVYGNSTDYVGITDPTGVGGNISEDPQFVDEAVGDLRVRFGSAAVDAGISVDGISVDKLGTPRSIDGDQDGVDTPDIGAFELSPPVAIAGQDLVLAPGETGQLNAQESFDIDGQLVSYEWRQTSGPAVLLMDAMTALAFFQAPDVSGSLSFQLIVTDDVGAVGQDEIEVRINAAPVANAGEDFVLNQGEVGQLTAAASHDSDGTLVEYAWQQLSGSPVSISGADTTSPTFVAPDDVQPVTIELTVTDNDGATSTDGVTVFINLLPIAVAGSDVSVGPGAQVSLNGSSSRDPDGAVSAYHWDQTGGTAVSLSGTDAPILDFTAPSQPQTMQFRLTVTDDREARSTDTVSVVVVPGVPRPSGGGGGGGGSLGVLSIASLLLLAAARFFHIRLTGKNACLLLLGMMANVGETATFEVDQANPACADNGGQPFCTIDAALGVATNGDTVLVHPGTYVENIDFEGEDIDLVSSQGPTATTLRGNGGQVVRIGPFGKIEGFTIAGGSAASGAGMVTIGSGTIVRGNVFENNQQSGNGYGAAIAGSGGAPVIDGNLFENNSCNSFQLSGVIGFVGPASPTVVNNILRFNPCRAINMTLSAGMQPVVAFNTVVQNPVGIRVDRRHSTNEQIYRNNILVGNDVGLAVESGIEAYNPLWESNVLFDNQVNYEVIQDQTGIAGNIADDPQFVDGQALDYRLRAGSPSVDAGATVAGVFQDFLRNSRAVDGNQDGAVVPDMGAFESSPPVADAGMDFVATRADNLVLDGTQSHDIDGQIAAYSWVQTSGAAVELMGAMGANPEFLAPATAGVLSFELEVTDDSGLSATDTLQLRINAPPDAAAGADFVIDQGETVLLDGTTSSDEDGVIATFAWAQASGPIVMLMDADSATPAFVAPQVAGVLSFRLTVTDDDGESDTDSVSVMVRSSSSGSGGSGGVNVGGGGGGGSIGLLQVLALMMLVWIRIPHGAPVGQ